MNVSIEDAENRKATLKSIKEDTMVPKVTNKNIDEFETQFYHQVGRKDSSAGRGIALDYLLRLEETGDYKANYASRNDRLKACMVFSGPAYTEDGKILYSLLTAHVDANGSGGSLIKKYKQTSDGRKCFLALCKHFKNDSYLNNLAVETNLDLSKIKWSGPRQNWSMNSVYDKMTTTFNNLDSTGPAFTLSEQAKVLKH